MSIRSKFLATAAAAALTLGGGIAALATSGAANAATPSCGGNCVNLYLKEFDQYATTHPSLVLDVFRQGEKINQPLILWPASNHDPAEDFTYSFQGTTADFFAAGLVSSAVNLHYASNPAYELEYSPYGVDSGLCAGVPATAAAGTRVSLQPCGVSAKTVWIEDFYDSPGTFPFYAAVNGSDTNFSHPFVMQYPSAAYWRDLPRPQVQTNTLQTFSQGGHNSVYDNEAWYATPGILP